MSMARREEMTRRNITSDEVAEYIIKKFEKRAKKNSDTSKNFVWRKKIIQEVARGEYSKIFSKKRQREREEEIEKAEKRRSSRDMEKLGREEEMTLINRERHMIESELGEKAEGEFLYNQSKIRSEIRLREGRAKPIDILINQLNPVDELNFKLSSPPFIVLENLTVKELEEIEDEIKLHLEFDSLRAQYWKSLLVICNLELGKARLREAKEEEKLCFLFAEEDRGIHTSIEGEVKNFLIGKNYGELEAVESEIVSINGSGKAKVVEFWESVLHQIHIIKAKALLTENWEKPTQRIIDEGRFIDETPADDENRGRRSIDDYPPPLDDETESGEEPEELVVLGNGGGESESLSPSKIYVRKPKYVNRVHTSYVWNKYNRVHYDHENPPPKQILGYRFNLFYTGLMDSSSVPSYSIEKDEESLTTCIIKFHGGPPYEDIAFRIVAGEWEYSKRKGFKCTFGRGGVFQLHFNFKRYSYRR